MRRRFALLSMLLLSPVGHAGLAEGEAAFYREDYETARKEWLPLAEAGNATAQRRLGDVYNRVNGHEDNAQEITWYLKAAEQGDTEAQYSLVWSYLHSGKIANAFRSLNKAAAQGHAKAQHELGNWYRYGSDVKKDGAIAAGWYRKAAELGLADAAVSLGELYEEGFGVPRSATLASEWKARGAALVKRDSAAWDRQNYSGSAGLYAEAQAAFDRGDYTTAAERWDRYSRAALNARQQFSKGKSAYDQKDYATALASWQPLAEDGHSEAQIWLGSLYEQGHGIQQNPAVAKTWYRKAAESGNAWAIKRLKAIEDARLAAEKKPAPAASVPVQSQIATTDISTRLADGKAAYWKQQYASAWALLAPLAEQGNAEAQYLVGRLWFFKQAPISTNGTSSLSPSYEGVRYFRLSAEQGFADAQLWLGRALMLGSGVDQVDAKEGRYWLEKARAQGKK